MADARYVISDNGRASTARAWYIFDTVEQRQITYGDDPDPTPNIGLITADTPLPFFRLRDAHAWLIRNRPNNPQEETACPTD